jgi:hypothetical protein
MKSALLVVLSAAFVSASWAQPPEPAPPAAAAPTAAAPATAALKPRATPPPVPVLEGTVRSVDGKAVEKALILAQPVVGSFREAPAIGRTDAAGKFRLALKGAGAHRLRVEATGWAAVTLKEVRPGTALAITLKKGAAIEGTVRDGTTSAPLAGVVVDAVDANSVYTFWEPEAGRVRATTDDRGRFRIEGLASGLHEVVARLRGFSRAARSSVPVGSRVDLYLFPGATLTGVVRDGQGEPVPGALVRAEGEIRGFGGGGSALVAAGRDGRFELTGLSGGPYRVVARHPDFSPAWLPGVMVERGAEAQVDVVLHRGAAVSGRLLAGEDRPVPGRVGVQETDDRPVPQGLDDSLRTEAGADGRFRLVLPPGSHTLAVVAPGYAPRSVDTDVGTAGAPIDLGDIAVEPGLVIRGRVRDKAGLPIVESQVWGAMPRMMGGGGSGPSEARGEADGTFLLGGLTAGLYRVSVRARGYAEQVKQVEAGTSTEFVLDRAGSISGLVVDDAGAPVESFRILARPLREMGPTSPSPKMDNSSGTDGRFLLEDVPEGTWVVEASAPDRANGVASDVRVAAGSSVDVGRIRLTAGGVVRGLVLDTGGAAVPGATVTIQASGREFWGRGGGESVSDPAGAFEIRGVAPGTVEVIAEHRSYATGRATGVEVDPTRGPAEARIVMTQGGRIEGRVLRRDGTGVVAMVYASPVGPGGRRGPMADASANTGPDGTFVIEHAPAGRTHIAVLTGSAGVMESRHMREVDVREGETTSVEFVSREILVTGHVTRGGVPAPGIQLRLMSGQGGRMTMMSGGGFGALSAPPTGPQRLTGVTDEGGAFALLVDEPGKHFVNASTADGRVNLPPREVEIPDMDGYVLDLAFSGQTVTGIVLDRETEQPLSSAHVGARPRETGARGGGGGMTGPDGRFLLELEPGDYRLHARAEGYAAEATDLTVGSGGAADLRLLLSRGGMISGRILDVAGRPVSGISVNATAGEGVNMQGGSGQSLPDGSFQIAGLSAGMFTVTAQSELGGFAIRRGVALGQDGVSLTLRPGGRVQVQVRGPDGAPAEGAWVRVAKISGAAVALNSGGRTSAQGTADLIAPAGEVELEVNKDKLRGRTTVSVAPGAVAAAELTLAEAPAAGAR